MEQLLKQLIRAAAAERAVAVQELTNGMQLLAYPLEADIVIAVGYCGGSVCTLSAEELVRRRSDNLPKYSSWLPAMFADSTLHVVRRLADVDPHAETPPLSLEELMCAMELLA
jgi:hypothetical protein